MKIVGVPAATEQRWRGFCAEAPSRASFADNAGSCHLQLAGCALSTASCDFVACRRCADEVGICIWCGVPLAGHPAFADPRWEHIADDSLADDPSEQRCWSGVVIRAARGDRLAPTASPHTARALRVPSGEVIDLTAREQSLLERYHNQQVLVLGRCGVVAAEGIPWRRIAAAHIRRHSSDE